MALIRGTAPQLQVSGGWTGTSDADAACSTAPCLEPPDPSVAVSASYVVQSTNDGIRIMDRSGVLLRNYFLPDFFAESPGQVYGSDPRVFWDNGLGRWLAMEMSADCNTGHLYVAASRTADPTGAWDISIADYVNVIPDYPGLGYSTDKVAIGYNPYGLVGCQIQGFIGGGLLIFDKTALLGGAVKGAEYTADGTAFTYRPSVGAADDSPALWVVFGRTNGSSNTYDVTLMQISGTQAGGDLTIGTQFNLTADPAQSVGPFVDPVPLSAPGAKPGFGTAIDSRPTDSVFAGGKLWWTSTTTCTPPADRSRRACVRVTQSTGTTVNQDFTIGAFAQSTYSGGITVSGNGTTFITYAQSSVTRPISTFATYQLPTDTPNAIHVPAVIAAGVGNYAGARWGDFVGLAPDPSDIASAWQGNEQPDSRGGWTTRISKLTGAQTGVPDGTLNIEGGSSSTTLTTVQLSLTPTSGTGTSVARVSNVGPDASGNLAQSRTLPLGTDIWWSLTDPATGGSGATGSRKIWVQWGDGAGTWSTPATGTLITFTTTKVVREAGLNRFATAAAVSAATYRRPGVPVAYVAYAF
ncbi:MAG: hypothetical protein M3017_02505, partial [Actinomycetota bacterium]|nr:hypothetical protein [Actinomycetota bacterium]